MNRAFVSTTAPVTGLTEREVVERRGQGLGNVPPPPTGRTYSQIVRDNVFTSINVIMFLLGTALVVVGRPGDALVSCMVISLNILVAVVQEIRAKRTLDRIALLTRPRAMVLREGQVCTLSPEELVVGDVLQVGPGDQIVLDGRLVSEGRLTVDESLLTGESDAIPKQAGDPVYSGSFCVTGSGLYEAEQVGVQSLSNKITANARAFRRELTPLQSEISRLIRLVLLIVIYMEFLIFVNALIKQLGAAETVADATLVVGLVPNGLFLSMSVAYALGAVRILQYGTLVQQSNAIESLSNVDVLCTDKTGTLTTNRLQVNGLHPLGMAEPELQQVLGTMVAGASSGNQTSAAIAAAYPIAAPPCRAEVPFSSERKWSAIAFSAPPFSGTYALGAPEMLRPYLENAQPGGTPPWPAIAATAGALANQGLRVLLVTHHPDPAALDDQGDDSRLPPGMQPLGLVSLRDELRPEARETLAAFARAGVQVKIISGDSPETVAALARQAGLDEHLTVVSGLDLAGMDEAQFTATAQAATVFGRIAPQQKAQLVQTLRRLGHYVAMIGDGVNDVLALKQANLGVGMQSGSQATRGVADLVLMDNSFASLPPAVAEGQRIVNGMDDMLRLFLTRIFTMALLILSSLVVGNFPLALRHGSIVTLFSVGIPAVFLAVWARPGPRHHGSVYGRVAHFVIPPVIITSAMGLLLFYGTWLVPIAEASEAGSLAAAQQAALLAAARPGAQTSLAIFTALCGLFLVIFVEPPTRWWAGGDDFSGDWRPTALAAVLMVALFITTRVPLMRRFYALAYLSPQSYLLIGAAVLIWVLLVRSTWRYRLLERFLEPAAGAPKDRQ